MIRAIERAAAIGAALLAAIGFASAAQATVFNYDLQSAASSTGTQTYAVTVGGQSLTVKMTAWHAVDTNTSANTNDAIKAATLANYNGGGTGVLYGNDNDNDGSHQIDNNSSGADFVMLQFSEDVLLSSLSRNVYSVSGTTCCDSDAAYWGDTGHLLGGPSATSSIQLANYQVDESVWTMVAGGSNASTATLSPAKAASVWLVGAAFNQTGDAFKISGFSATTAAVPEPSGWAMMIIGFGAVGWALRSNHRLFALG